MGGKPAISAEEFRALQSAAGLTNRALAEELALTERAIERYRQGKRGVPGPVARLLRQLAGEEKACST